MGKVDLSVHHAIKTEEGGTFTKRRVSQSAGAGNRQGKMRVCPRRGKEGEDTKK